MIYPRHYEDKTGFSQIRTLLKSYCTSPLGEEMVDRIRFLEDLDSIERELSYGEEFSRILRQEPHFPDILFFDLREALARIRPEGTWLDQAELFDLRRSLGSLHHIVAFFLRWEDACPYPCLQREARSTALFPKIVEEIDRILDHFGQVQDHASPQLFQIRRQLSITTAGISRRLHILLKKAQDEGYVEKGLSPGMRDGRLVIPVSPAFKRKIKGIVHEESASGKTVYIEPEELVEANNQIRELEAAQQREIVRILCQVTDLIRPMAGEIAHAHRFMALIDVSRAKGVLAREFNAIKPLMEPRPLVNWQKAVHPLLQLSLQKQGKEVVPLDIRLDDTQRIVLISGPNAGGKSVCLKTVGLLQYMLQCGLMIPVSESSTAGVFQHLFIDIGDEQSIENDLSTYSSHLLNLKYFLKNGHSQTLLLIDEFGSGTEPKIGGAIAQAVLGRLNELRVMGVVTTHYDNLKHFAEDQEGIVNGAMLYDRHLMQALFRLEIGRPGSSFAVEIARKTGLPDEIIRQASDLVGSDYIDMDKHLQDIVRDKRYWQNKREQVKQMEKDLAELTRRYDEQLEQLKQQRKEILETARAEAGKLLESANAQIENTIRGIRESQAEKEKTRLLRQDLSEFKDQALSPAEEARIEQRLKREKGRVRLPKSEEERLLRKVRRLQQDSAKSETRKPAAPPVLPVVGDTVRIKGQDSVGVLSEIKGKKAVVVFGDIKTRLELERLEKAKPTDAKKTAPAPSTGARLSDNMHRINLQFKQEIDMRGMRADEAVMALQTYIDEAIVVGAAQVRILHGTGTGALRQVVRQYLSTVPQIQHFHDEHVQLGGTGITVVEFR